jgi:hypothetical protein
MYRYLRFISNELNIWSKIFELPHDTSQTTPQLIWFQSLTSINDINYSDPSPHFSPFFFLFFCADPGCPSLSLSVSHSLIYCFPPLNPSLAHLLSLATIWPLPPSSCSDLTLWLSQSHHLFPHRHKTSPHPLLVLVAMALLFHL